MRRALSLPLALLLAACGGDPAGSADDTATPASTGDTADTNSSGASGDTPTTSPDSTSEAASSTGAEPVGVTYYRDVKPLLDARCVQCHSPGNIAPFSLTTHEEAAPFAATLVDAAERARIAEALQRSNGHKGEAARILGVARSTLWRRLRELRLA